MKITKNALLNIIKEELNLIESPKRLSEITPPRGYVDPRVDPSTSWDVTEPEHEHTTAQFHALKSEIQRLYDEWNPAPEEARAVEYKEQLDEVLKNPDFACGPGPHASRDEPLTPV